MTVYKNHLSIAKGIIISLGLCSTMHGFVNISVLDNGIGNGLNPTGNGNQPTMIGETILPNSRNYLLEPGLTDGTNVSEVIAATQGGGTVTIREGEVDSFAFGVPFTLGAINTSSSDIDFEASVAGTGNGVRQNSAGSNNWGVDTDTTISNSMNTVLLFELALGATETGFSLLTLDLEGGVPGGAQALFGVYDANGLLTPDFGAVPNSGPEWGDNAEILWDFTGLNGDETIAFFVGDDNFPGGNPGTGYFERIAAGDFATINPVPEPSTFVLLGGLFGLTFFTLRRKK